MNTKLRGGLLVLALSCAILATSVGAAVATAATAGDGNAVKAAREIPAEVDAAFRPEAGVEYRLASGTLYHPAAGSTPGPAERESSLAWSLANEFVSRTALAAEYVVPAGQAGPAKDGWCRVVFGSKDGKSSLTVEVQVEKRLARLRSLATRKADTQSEREAVANPHWDATDSFGIYLTAEPVDRRLLASGKGDWSRVRPSGRPLISAADLVSYDLRKHSLKLQPAAVARIPRPPVAGTPFVVVANGELVYVGVFTTSSSSMSFAVPSITVDRRLPVTNQSPDTLLIERAYPSPQFGVGPDPRGDPRIKSALKALGKLRNDEQEP